MHRYDLLAQWFLALASAGSVIKPRESGTGLDHVTALLQANAQHHRASILLKDQLLQALEHVHLNYTAYARGAT